MQAYALPITVSAGERLVFNFDLSNSTPSPPYEGMSFETGIAGNQPVVGTWALYTELNAAGPLRSLTSAVNLGAFSISVFNNFTPTWVDDYLDGIFSTVLTIESGIFDPHAISITGNRFNTRVEPLAASVPEPGRLALFGLSFVLLGLRSIRPRRA